MDTDVIPCESLGWQPQEGEFDGKIKWTWKTSWEVQGAPSWSATDSTNNSGVSGQEIEHLETA